MPERERRNTVWIRVFVLVAIFLVATLFTAAGFSSFRTKLMGRYPGRVHVEGVVDRTYGPQKIGAARDTLYLDSEKEWLLMSQLECGAIAQTPQKDLVVPYFANFAAKTMVDIDPGRTRAYISWYLDNMNMPDRGGLSGTIYDFVVKDGELVPTYKYDSADSYAATFLSLVAYYCHRTGDLEFITSNLTSIDLAAQVILELQDHDGLVRVMPGSRTKYLMDNSECYRGLLDWAGVLEDLGEEGQARVYTDAALRIAAGIRDVLYDPEKEVYAWCMSWYGKRYPKVGKWYPDAVSQVDLIYCGVIQPSSEEAARIWERFNSQFPGWERGVTGDRFPWAKIALAAAMMDDAAKAERFLDWVREEYAETGRRYPWYVMESAGTLDAISLILSKAP